jgi:TetR/AcrR family transcriptional repressor of nem operon
MEGDCEGFPEPGTLRSRRVRVSGGSTCAGLARADNAMKALIAGELIKYKTRMLPWMPGRSAVDKERAFFAIFSTMIGAIAIARILSDQAARAKVLATARDFLLGSY